MTAAYWFFFFAVTLVWGVGCILLRTLEHPGSTHTRVNRFQSAMYVVGVVGWLGPVFLAGFPWWTPICLVVPPLLAGFLIRRITVPGSRQFHQLMSGASWFLLVLAYSILGLISRTDLWFIGAALFLAAGLWNLFSDYHLKPAMLEFYSNVDEEFLWSGPLLPEEAPVLAMLLPAFLFYPRPLGPLDSALPAALFRSVLVVLGVLLAAFVLGSLFSGSLVRNDLKRTALTRVFHGLTGLTLLLLAMGLAASARGPGLLHLDAGYWIGSGDAVHMAARRSELISVCLWVTAASLLVGLMSSLAVLVSIPGRAPEYDFFLSFSSVDRKAARILVRRARRLELQYFFSDESILAGERFREQIRKAIRNSREMVVLATPNSNESDWVRGEWAMAMVLEKAVIPIVFSMEARDLPDPLRERQAVPWEEVDTYLGRLVGRPRRLFTRRGQGGDDRPGGDQE